MAKSDDIELGCRLGIPFLLCIVFFIILIVQTVNTPKCTVSSPTGVVDGHEYVDLGLSVKWAVANVGEDDVPTHCLHFAWGETNVRKEQHKWQNYKFCNDNATGLTKYNTKHELGKIDNIIILENQDDIASVEWGGAWRIPAADEFQELIDNCSCEWGRLNGITGMKFISKINGNSIFFPACGMRTSSGRIPGIEHDGYYWSSSLSKGNPDSACGLHFNKKKGPDMLIYHRFQGLSVRAVQ